MNPGGCWQGPSESRKCRVPQRKMYSLPLKEKKGGGRWRGQGTPVLFFLPNIVLQCITKVHLISIFLFKVLSGRTDGFAGKNR